MLSSPSLTEGPYFVDEDLLRRDIRTDLSTGVMSAGIPLSLGINIAQLANCTQNPLTGAAVDI